MPVKREVNQELLRADLDARLMEVWLDLLGYLDEIERPFETWNLGLESDLGEGARIEAGDLVGGYLRWAYGRGYADRVREERQGKSPSLGREAGFTIID